MISLNSPLSSPLSLSARPIFIIFLSLDLRHREPLYHSVGGQARVAAEGAAAQALQDAHGAGAAAAAAVVDAAAAAAGHAEGDGVQAAAVVAPLLLLSMVAALAAAAAAAAAGAKHQRCQHQMQQAQVLAPRIIMHFGRALLLLLTGLISHIGAFQKATIKIRTCLIF